ncbi:4Fe-4S binding protein [Cognatiyoonia sp. IB215446]|uniref:4Fe-4S binding protein n=1 Tax=Cognatiyoonia sp. IB215446 TaxID=3097355 RepID=UPI002A140149|nr:4Fe-4S binding protein [Cognatiyoonia sp. IB215446]MDX8348450.1 4Fe-4S binding protein [Cognatiyoonia sp. IB215446]
MSSQRDSRKQLILCDCSGTQALDPAALETATGLGCSTVHTALCTREIDKAESYLQDGTVVIACKQQRHIFEELAQQIQADMPDFVDLRDRAGWSDDPASKSPKMAALAVEALLPSPAPKVRDVISQGTCLIFGQDDVCLEAATQLSETLSVTVLITGDEPPEPPQDFDIIRGQLRGATGSLGQFNLRFDALQEIVPGGRGPVQFTTPQDGARSTCDILLDLSGQPPLFPAPEKRDGYLRADPKHPPSVARAIFDAAQMVGTFEKPLYVRMEPALCAHSRAGKPACSNCLNACPTGAITSAGDYVSVDPMICAGCGACASLCPSGAISYDAPPTDDAFRRLQTLASTYRKAGGQSPRLLVHDASHGAEMIRLAARYGRGLPADVIPLSVEALASFGHAEMLAAFGAGFGAVSLILAPTSDRDTLTREAELASVIAGRDVALLDPADPDVLTETLYGASEAADIATPILPIGTRRQVARTAAKTLRSDDLIPLPKTAPYGAVVVDTEACTLCLACVSLCPSGALADNEDLPQLRFQEDACLQCGLCSNVCPESAITLEPRLNLTDAALTQIVLNEEEPFACVECGALFGVKSTIEKISEKLAGSHAMFANPEAARMIQMCDNCRIQAQYHSENNPFAGGERPRVRTTDDYFSDRKDH